MRSIRLRRGLGSPMRVRIRLHLVGAARRTVSCTVCGNRDRASQYDTNFLSHLRHSRPPRLG